MQLTKRAEIINLQRVQAKVVYLYPPKPTIQNYIHRYGFFAFVCVSIFTILFLNVIFFSVSGTNDSESAFLSRQESKYEDSQKYTIIKVMPGDTLWDIASKHYSTNDLWEYIYEIKKINHLATSNIQYGTSLKIPVK